MPKLPSSCDMDHHRGRKAHAGESGQRDVSLRDLPAGTRLAAAMNRCLDYDQPCYYFMRCVACSDKAVLAWLTARRGAKPPSATTSNVDTRGEPPAAPRGPTREPDYLSGQPGFRF